MRFALCAPVLGTGYTYCFSQFTEDVALRSDRSTDRVTELRELTSHFTERTHTDNALCTCMYAYLELDIWLNLIRYL